MTSLLSGWTLTAHAKTQMWERAVMPSELVLCLQEPETKAPNPKGNTALAIWWRQGVGALVNEGAREVVTVLLDGATRDDWEEVARQRQGGPEGVAERLLAELAGPRVAARRRRARERPEASPVEIRFVQPTAPKIKPRPEPKPEPQAAPAPRLDPAEERARILSKIHPSIRAIVLAQAGGDVSRLKVITPTKVEIL